MEKLARDDLGLDLAGYKDYVNNLKEFAHVNNDLSILAHESMTSTSDKKTLTLSLRKQADDIKHSSHEGKERVVRNQDAVMMALAKLQRKASGFLNVRDEAALDEVLDNFELYSMNSFKIADSIHKVCQKKKAELKTLEEQSLMHNQFENVDMRTLEESNVSLRQLEQIKLLVKVDPQIFVHTRHATHYSSYNLHDNFVDFTRLPPAEELPKEAKDLLYRPDKIQKLAEAYRRLSLNLSSNYMRKREQDKAYQAEHHKRVQYEARFPQK